MQSFEEWDQSDSFEIRKSESAPRSSHCSDAQEWERWRNAGELLGRVRKGLGFGDAALYQDESGLGSFKIQWWFNAKGQRYSASYLVTDEDLSQAMTIELIADDIVRRWKRDARSKLG